MPTYTIANNSGTATLVTISVTQRWRGRMTSKSHATVAIRLAIEKICSGVTVHLSRDHDRLSRSRHATSGSEPCAHGGEYGPGAERSDRQAVRLHQRLAAQRL